VDGFARAAGLRNGRGERMESYSMLGEVESRPSKRLLQHCPAWLA
jgi:hypothetical protein